MNYHQTMILWLWNHCTYPQHSWDSSPASLSLPFFFSSSSSFVIWIKSSNIIQLKHWSWLADTTIYEGKVTSSKLPHSALNFKEWWETCLSLMNLLFCWCDSGYLLMRDFHILDSNLMSLSQLGIICWVGNLWLVRVQRFCKSDLKCGSCSLSFFSLSSHWKNNFLLVQRIIQVLF